jgi:CheY-like chemotaxis protein
MEKVPPEPDRSAEGKAIAGKTASTPRPPRTKLSNQLAETRVRAWAKDKERVRGGDAAAAAVAKAEATAERSDEASFFPKTIHHRLSATAAGFFQRGTVTIVFVAKDFSRFAVLVARLRREQDVQLMPIATGAAGLRQLSGKPLDLVIVDELLDDMSGIEFVKQLVKVNPLANAAIVGSLAAEEFHESTEGLGVLMQLPSHPSEKDADALLAVLAKITGLMQPTPKATP